MSNNQLSSNADGHQLKRSLHARHLNMIALGGVIGTGLFVASGASISSAGPGGAFLGYAIIGLMIYFLMTGLGEMSTHLPVSGSLETYASKYVDPALGFSLGWSYWFGWCITVAAELAAAGLVMAYWFPEVPMGLWAAIFLILLFGLNLLSTRAYGESEFWFAGIKVIAVFVFLILGILLLLGLGGPSPGLKNWTTEEAPFVGGLLGMINIFFVAGYSFQGTEMVAIAGGESADPQKNIPTAIKTVFWRILILYVGSILVIGLLIPYTDPDLLRNGVEDISVSPFVLILSEFGFKTAAMLMNFVVLTSVLSCGNSALYVSTRMLYALAKEQKAPKVFDKVNRRGIPANALYFTVLIGVIGYILSSVGGGVVYIWLLNCSALNGFFAWVIIGLSHYRFRRAFILQGHSLDELKYKAKWFPIGPIFTVVLCAIVILGQNYSAFIGDNVNWYGVFVSYVSIPVFLGIYLVYKKVKKTRIIPLKEIDLSGKYE